MRQPTLTEEEVRFAAVLCAVLDALTGDEWYFDCMAPHAYKVAFHGPNYDRSVP